MIDGVRDWLAEREYSAVHEVKGVLSQVNYPDPTVYERANYMKAILYYDDSS